MSRHLNLNKRLLIQKEDRIYRLTKKGYTTNEILKELLLATIRISLLSCNLPANLKGLKSILEVISKKVKKIDENIFFNRKFSKKRCGIRKIARAMSSANLFSEGK